MSEQNECDFVIIGAGTAGCVVASRLSEDSSVSVLIIEAGPLDKDKNTKIPAAFSKTFKSEIDYGFETTPQECLNGRNLYLPRGKIVGGSSSINAMIYIRGNAADYDHWSKLGAEGWSFEEVLPYFKKSENQQDILSEFHGVGGEAKRHQSAIYQQVVRGVY